MRARTAVLSLAVLLLASVCGAQGPAPALEVSIFGGRLFGGTLAQGTNALFSAPVDVTDALTYGAGVGYNVTSRFELGVRFTSSGTSFAMGNTGLLFGGGAQDLGDFRINYLLGYGSVRLGRHRLMPYLTFGAGAAVLNPQACRDAGASCHQETRFTASLGTGMKVFPDRRFGLRIDGHYYGTWLPLSGQAACSTLYRCDSNRWLSNGDLTGGVVLAF